jgi:hypothetical protein
MKILYVTTFNKELFSASGSQMLSSFFSTQKKGDMLVCYEGLNPNKNFKSFIGARFKFYDLATSNFLNNWLSENKDVIPPAFGGVASQDKKPQAFLGWNFRAAGWFRKIATLEYALSFKDQYDLIIFVDSDSKFLKDIDLSIYENILKDSDYFYHWGKERKKKDLGVESGFIGFKTTSNGLEILNYWINKFRGKEFRRYLRWDDGGMFSNVLIENNFKFGKDLVSNYEDNGRSQSHVIERGPFSGFVLHDKGSHKRLGLTNEKK